MSGSSSIEEVRAFVLAELAALAPVRARIGSVLDHVLAEDVIAQQSVPGFANSAMDGYAIHSIDTTSGPVRLSVIGTVMAGEVPRAEVHRGEAIRIMTGARMPDGADVVCPLEQANEEATAVRIERSFAAQTNVRYPGEDVVVGQVVFEEGTVLGPAHIGVLASLGLPDVAVHPRPRVGILSSGDELVGDAGLLEESQIRDANRPALLALIARSNFVGIDLGIVRDEQSLVIEAIEHAVSCCDAVIAGGGVSYGDRDAVRSAIEKLGGNHRARSFEVSMRPAKPFAFGLIGDASVPVFGLPGNPVSALIAYEMFARPALLRLGGHRLIDRPRLSAIADEPISRKADGKVHVVRVTLSVDGGGALHVRSAGKQNPHLLHTMAVANALAILPDGHGPTTGDKVMVILIEPEAIAPHN